MSSLDDPSHGLLASISARSRVAKRCPIFAETRISHVGAHTCARARRVALRSARDLRSVRVVTRTSAARWLFARPRRVSPPSGRSSSSVTARATGTSAMRRAPGAEGVQIASFMSAFARASSLRPWTTRARPPSASSRAARSATPPAKLTLNFYVPHNVEFDAAEVEQVQVPATSGDMGVLPGHVPTVVQMRAG